MVANGVPHAILLKMIPLPVTRILHKLGLLSRFSPFLHASTQSLAEVLRQLPASPELQAVLSYIFPTYGGCRAALEKTASPPFFRIPLELCRPQEKSLMELPFINTWIISSLSPHCPPCASQHGSFQKYLLSRP